MLFYLIEYFRLCKNVFIHTVPKFVDRLFLKIHNLLHFLRINICICRTSYDSWFSVHLCYILHMIFTHMRTDLFELYTQFYKCYSFQCNLRFLLLFLYLALIVASCVAFHLFSHSLRLTCITVHSFTQPDEFYRRC